MAVELSDHKSTVRAAIQVTVLDDVMRWDALRDEWSELFALNHTASFAMHWDWMREWWRVYGERYGRGGLRIFTFRRAGQLVGVLPLYRQTRGAFCVRVQSLRFISTGEHESEETCPDYLDLLARPGEESACVEAFRDALIACQHEWDELVLCDVSEDSPLAGIPKMLQATNWIADSTERGRCPIAELQDGFEKYIERLSAKSRRNTRQHLRVAARAGAAIELASGPNEAQEFFEEFVQLHQARWADAGKPGCFASTRFLAFHRSLASRWVHSGTAILARLRCNDATCAVIYGFSLAGRLYFYQSGVARDSESLESPGITAYLLLMKSLSGHGIVEYDFLRGNRAYKQWLSTKHARLLQVRAVRPGLRVASRAAIHRALRTSKRLLRRVRGQQLAEQSS